MQTPRLVTLRLHGAGRPCFSGAPTSVGAVSPVRDGPNEPCPRRFRQSRNRRLSEWQHSRLLEQGGFFVTSNPPNAQRLRPFSSLECGRAGKRP